MELRYRTKGGYSLAGPHKEETIWNSCSQNTWIETGASLVGLYLGTHISMYDTVIPNFFRRRKQGEVFFNPMSRVETTYSSGGGSGTHCKATGSFLCPEIRTQETRWNSDVFQYYAQKARVASPNGMLPIKTVLTDSDIGSLATEVSTRVLSQRGRNQSNLWETGAELRKTLSMMDAAVTNARQVLSRVPSRALNGASSAYLLYRYGMRPVIADITNIMSKLEVQTRKLRQTTRVVDSISSRNVEYTTIAGGAANRGVNIIDVDTVVMRAMSLDEYVTSQLYESGVHLKGLLTLPWELIPYSFVVDWFINVGDVIGAIMPTPSFLHLGSCLVSERTTSSTYHAGLTTANAGWTVVRPQTGSCVGTTTVKTRSAISSPGLVIKSNMRLDNPIRIADGLALIAQKLTSMRK